MKYNGGNLKEVLAAHERHLCLRVDVEGDNTLADFSNASLCNVDFSGVDLSDANFSGCTMIGCKFDNSYLSDTDFSHARLYDIRFTKANLIRANFEYAGIEASDFADSWLNGANFYKAAISFSDFVDCSISDTTCFFGCRLRGVKNMPYIPMACPDEGEFIGWKMCTTDYTSELTENNVFIVKLRIPADAKRSSGVGRKCRASKAEVLAIYDMKGEDVSAYVTPHSFYDTSVEYQVGTVVETERAFDDDRWNECTSGIHFFMNRAEAMDYVILTSS